MRFAAVDTPPTLHLIRTTGTPLPPRPRTAAHFTSRLQHAPDIPALALWQGAAQTIFYLGEGLRVVVEPAQILSQRSNRFDPAMEQVALLGSGFAIWMEQQGLLALHGAAVVLEEGSAVAFLGHNGAGKSTLAIHLMAAGASLLTDDLLAVQVEQETVLGRPGYPQIRLTAAEAARRGQDASRLAPVLPGHPKRRLPVGNGAFGRFAAEPVPLRRLYLLERGPPSAGGPSVAIATLSAGEAVAALVRFGYLRALAPRLSPPADRLARLATVVERVGLRRLRLPDDLDALDAVHRAIHRDLVTLR